MEKIDKTQQSHQASTRERTNRFLGLSSYAGGVVLLCILALCVYDSGIKDGIGSLSIIAVAALACFGIGYTTSRRK